MNAPRIRAGSIATATQVSGVIVPRTERAADIATIVDHHGHGPTDDMLLARVFRTLGWQMLSDDALAQLADAYEANAAFRERINAENRALRSGHR